MHLLSSNKQKVTQNNIGICTYFVQINRKSLKIISGMCTYFVQINRKSLKIISGICTYLVEINRKSLKIISVYALTLFK